MGRELFPLETNTCHILIYIYKVEVEQMFEIPGLVIRTSFISEGVAVVLLAAYQWLGGEWLTLAQWPFKNLTTFGVPNMCRFSTFLCMNAKYNTRYVFPAPTSLRLVLFVGFLNNECDVKNHVWGFKMEHWC